MAVNFGDSWFIGAFKPVDTRMVVDNKSQRNSITYPYVGMIVTVLDDGTGTMRNYQLVALPATVNNNWVELLGGGGSGTSQYIEKTFTNQSVVDVNHGWQKKPVVTVINNNRNAITHTLHYIDDNNIRVAFNQNESGTVIVQGRFGSPPPVDELNDILDVTVENKKDGQLLVYNVNGSTAGWENQFFKLNDIYDVEITNVNNGNVLQYNGTNWIAGDVEVKNSLQDLTDTQLNNINSGQILEYNGTNWINTEINVKSSLEELTDTQLSNVKFDDVLKYNGTNWINEDATFEKLNDTNISSLSSGQELKYDGSNWVNTDLKDKYVPLGGTKTGYPVTGDIIIDEGYKLKSVNGFSIHFRNSSINFRDKDDNSQAFMTNDGFFFFDKSITLETGKSLKGLLGRHELEFNSNDTAFKSVSGNGKIFLINDSEEVRIHGKDDQNSSINFISQNNSGDPLLELKNDGQFKLFKAEGSGVRNVVANPDGTFDYYNSGLEGLTDVQLNNPQTGQQLIYGTNGMWQNQFDSDISQALFVDGGNGNNQTAIKGDIGKPFATIQAAINASSGGEQIFVFPETYIETLSLKNNTNLHLFRGVEIDINPGSNEIGISESQNLDRVTITGNGKIINNTSQPSVFLETDQGGIIELDYLEDHSNSSNTTSSNSQIYFENNEDSYINIKYLNRKSNDDSSNIGLDLKANKIQIEKTVSATVTGSSNGELIFNHNGNENNFYVGTAISSVDDSGEYIVVKGGHFKIDQMYSTLTAGQSNSDRGLISYVSSNSKSDSINIEKIYTKANEKPLEIKYNDNQKYDYTLSNINYTLNNPIINIGTIESVNYIRLEITSTTVSYIQINFDRIITENQSFDFNHNVDIDFSSRILLMLNGGTCLSNNNTGNIDLRNDDEFLNLRLSGKYINTNTNNSFVIYHDRLIPKYNDNDTYNEGDLVREDSVSTSDIFIYKRTDNDTSGTSGDTSPTGYKTDNQFWTYENTSLLTLITDDETQFITNTSANNKGYIAHRMNTDFKAQSFTIASHDFYDIDNNGVADITNRINTTNIIIDPDVE